MNNYVKIEKISTTNNTLTFNILTNGKISKYISKNTMQIEYDFSLNDIPNSILVIPFISNILPLIWITNSTLQIDELDETFYKQINKIKKAYQQMAKKIKLKGKIKVNKLKNNTTKTNNSTKSICFFSGGVDSTSSLISHLNEKIETLTIWGSDISINNINGWTNVKKHINNITQKLNIPANFCKSNFRDIINYDEINKLIIPKIKDNYWHAYQHSIAIIAHAVPYCYKENIITIYFPATLSPKYRKRTCASIPKIDNNFIFSNTKTIHDGYEKSRLDRIENIANYNKSNKKKIPLRVCWQSLNGKNCTHCEKCFRTILELLSIKEDPKDYNFDILSSTYQLIQYDITNLNKKDLKKYHDYYQEIKQKTKKNNLEQDDKINWILTNKNF